jgi:adenine phosphoribosyltransferase
MDFKVSNSRYPRLSKPGIYFGISLALLSNQMDCGYTLDTHTQKVSDGRRSLLITWCGMESRVFIWATSSLPSSELDLSRPQTGQLPAAVHTVSTNWSKAWIVWMFIKMHFHVGSRYLIVDDLIATGGTAGATAKLLQKIGCEIVGFGLYHRAKGFGWASKTAECTSDNVD